MYRYLLVFLFLITSLNAEINVKEVNKLFELSLDELMNISVISASKKNESILKSPSAIEIFTKDELELLKCNKLSQCLEFATGMSSVNGEGNIFATTTIRGNTLVNYNTNTLLLVDGIPILNPYHGSFNLDSIPLSSVAQIEIVKGAASVLYGSNAINGVINIITISDKDTGMIRTRYGTNNTLLASTALSYELSKNFSMQLFVEHLQSDGETLSIKDELIPQNTREFSQESKNTSLITKVKYKELWFYTQLFQRTLPNYKTRGFTNGAYDAKEDNTENEYLLGLGYKQEINNDIFVKFQTIYHNWTLTKDRLENTSQWDYDSDSFYNELEAHFFTNNDSSNILGVSYELANASRYKSDENTYDVGMNNQATHNFSIYDNGNYMINETLNLLYGARYFYSKYYDVTQAKNINNDNLSGRTGLIYNPIKNIAIKALYSQAYRVPTYFEKEVDSKKVKGNTNLIPEVSNSYDLILAHELESFNYSLGLFYTQIDNKISRTNLTSTVKKYQNYGDLVYYGFEANTKFRFDSTFWGFANYTYTKPNEKNDDYITQFTYNHMLNLALSKLLFEEYLVNTNLKYLDDWGEASSYTLLNLSVDYKPNYMKNISFELIAKNILNEKIDLPEIARDNEKVTTIPSIYESRIYLGLKYDF